MRFLSFYQQHNIKKRSLYEETCPPPYIIEVTEQCNDSCFDDDYCVGNQMCCFDGCSYVCMDPVPSVPGNHSNMLPWRAFISRQLFRLWLAELMIINNFVIYWAKHKSEGRYKFIADLFVLVVVHFCSISRVFLVNKGWKYIFWANLGVSFLLLTLVIDWIDQDETISGESHFSKEFIRLPLVRFLKAIEYVACPGKQKKVYLQLSKSWGYSPIFIRSPVLWKMFEG